MPRVTRRRFLEAVGSASALSLAGCSTDADDDPTPVPTRTGTATDTATATPTATPTATATPRAPLDESIGFAAMLARTPTHPEMPDASYVWARYVDAAGLLGSVDDQNIGQRLRDGWLGSGPPAYTESDAFELVHVQPGSLSNVTLGRGDFDASTTVEGMVGDGWRRLGGDTERYTFLGYGGYTAAVGDRLWIVVSSDDTTIAESLTAAVETDPLVDHLDAVDRAAVSRASEEEGNYLVVQRSVPGDYAAGIALDYAPYRYPIGVLHYAEGRESPSWQRVEHRFRTQIAGELRAVDFGEDFG
ncbi:hypothetical protein [Haloplanus aerogenes]|uniref:Uncharacterized protein n=1 Tax=Haloplanus aerogenes TaxID=660522 RepID=A0A3M0CWB6_9EURY|nr:hypothetical protein [Haloplanus aerogenes]AZH25219.1 hypothetical protein DU502_07415 [Haloplanus aerogenes]RMB13552.1 hypothetical protein ATH50_1991 [Haloplanus aerogenes]